MNTQKAVTTVWQNRYDQAIILHRCSDPTPKADAIYRRLKYKSKPNIIRKFVVHKSEYEKMDNILRIMNDFLLFGYFLYISEL